MTDRNPDDKSVFPDPVYARTVLEPLFEKAKRHALEPLSRINKAHCVMLTETGILAPDKGGAIARALEVLEARDFSGVRYTGEHEDLFFLIEGELVKALGIDLAGRLHTGRSRNDMDHTISKISLKGEIDRLAEKAGALAATLARKAQKEKATVIVAYTHGQPAQPTTFGHYLAAALDVLVRDMERLEAARGIVDLCPMGAAAITTTGFPIDRHRMAELLGFSAPTRNSYGSIAGVDYVTATYSALSLMVLHLGRLVQDFQFWTSFEVGQLYVKNSLVQISSIMPQKRNPVPIEHLRLLGSLAGGHAEAMLKVMHNTPFTDMNDSEGEVQAAGYRAFEEAGRMFDLLGALTEGIEVNPDRVAENIDRSCITATELADTLVRTEGLSFREAHEIAAAISRRVVAKGESLGSGGYAFFPACFEAVTGRRSAMTAEAFAAAVSAEHFIAVRERFGGPGADALGEQIDHLSERIAALEEERREHARSHEKAAALLTESFARLCDNRKTAEK